MPVLLAASSPTSTIKRQSSNTGAASMPRISYYNHEDLTVLCLPGVKKKHKWIDADGVISLWWLGRKSDSDDDHRKFHHHSERLKKYVNPTERSEELQTLLLCRCMSTLLVDAFFLINGGSSKSLTILKENDMPTSGVVPMTREKPSSTSPRSTLLLKAHQPISSLLHRRTK
ncbi:hypothetical protein CPB85DRAFT_1455932 [Mucidula mucida]|nr:hypothetical protein CPB85DRAFT_1455932 [Mucidula mucida]